MVGVGVVTLCQQMTVLIDRERERFGPEDVCVRERRRRGGERELYGGSSVEELEHVLFLCNRRVVLLCHQLVHHQKHTQTFTPKSRLTILHGRAAC